MSREFDIVVPPGKRRERLDVFLTRHVENATRSKVQKAIEAGLVQVNGKQAKASYQVTPGEAVHVVIPKPPPVEAAPEDIPLDIVYEDKFLIVINKPAGMVTHPAYGNYSGTLVNALLHHRSDNLSHLEDGTEAIRPGIVHRLDKDTSGLMVIAKDDVTHSWLSKQFSARTIEREYWAIVWGFFKKGEGLIEANLGRSKSDRKKIAVTSEGKTAVTEYKVIDKFDFLSLIRLKLKTGRTHQIRVHLHHVGHPVFGDPTYGGRRMAWYPSGAGVSFKQRVQYLLSLINRQALHAKTIGFIHPETREMTRFDSELPTDFQQVLSEIRS
jgi:23S rRNA pseudouridine1911/1915/1917 synthase